MNKNLMINAIKKHLKCNNNKKFYFPTDTIVELDRYDEYIPTLLISMSVKKDVLYLKSYTEKYGIETDKVSDFHTDFVKEFYTHISA